MNKAIIEGPDVGACGRFNIVVKNADGSVKKDYGWQSNLITQSGLDAINKEQGFYLNNYVRIVLGTGSGTPSIADTNLFEPLTDYKANIDAEKRIGLTSDLKLKADYMYPDGYAHGAYRWGCTFNNINNKNITEIGLCNTESSSAPWRIDNLLTHAIIRDENGQPTAITVLSGELLQIQYEVYCFFPFTTKQGTIKLKKTPDMAIPEQYTEEEYDYQLQTFRCVSKETTEDYSYLWTNYIESFAPFFIKIPDDATQGPVDFDKWKVQYKTNNLNGSAFTTTIMDLFNPTHANNATFFVNMDQEYRIKNLASVEKINQTNSYNDLLSDTMNSNKSKYYTSINKYQIEGYHFSETLIITPFHKDGRYKNSSFYVYNNGNSGDNGLRGLFVSNAKLGRNSGHFWFTQDLGPDNSVTTPNMMVVFSKKGTGEGIKKEFGWFLELTFAAKTVGVDFDSVKIVNASMDTSAKVLNQTHTLDLTYEEGATYNVEIQSLVENVSAEELVSVNGLTLTQVAQSGSFKVKVTVSKEGMVPRTFTQSFTIASA